MDSYMKCREDTRNKLAYPVDNRSLYANRTYDNETTNRRCYENNPIKIVEGFGKVNAWTVVIVALIIIVAIYAYYKYISNSEVVHIGGMSTMNLTDISLSGEMAEIYNLIKN